MTSSRNFLLMVLLVASACIAHLEAKTVFRRTDKISENFKQLDLPPEEIDPNVAPPESEPPKVDADADADVVEQAVVTPASLVDESANEIASGDVDVETPNAVAAEVAAPEAAAPAVATTLAAKPKPKPTAAPTTAKPENPISKFCKCTETHCDCCRKFGLPLLPSGPGCAKIAYLGNDEMSVSLKYGDITLASRRISSKRARPICVGLPGGYSKFCGKVYGLSRSKDAKDFKACLAFELRADDEVEASLRVSCFKFGPEGLRVAEAEPLPVKPSSDDDDDDDDDLFGFAAGGDDDEDDEDDYDSDNDADADADTDDDDDAEDYADDDEAEAPEDADYGGFSLAGLLDELDDDDEEKPAKKPAAVAAVAAVDQTREHVTPEGQGTTTSTSVNDQVQSKDDSGAVATGETAAAVAPVEGGEVVVTPTPDTTATATATDDDSTTPKSKKSKKTKKNKKKKSSAVEATDETGFAYELLNGILDFFN
ncbi:uncharacterized protein LOC128265673 [Drosophila gunungcola]|uniref:uncharacterized protein LOC128265673 n=1 Tax=Drosophila gunungcola TaxID=103775 RepID=UPI0022E7312B|nr:uncharacterized protein LOC128265673 [Drosophila gunungcola]XP_052857816.1 uncharacterized protein LOC128265673 [Drosophila gunungcola]